MNKIKKAILLGMILGDTHLQKTGKKNARIRLEHSEKQKDYLLYKGSLFPEYFQGKPKKVVRFNPIFKKTYTYYRWQSNASPEIGKFHRLFYKEGKKVIPKELPKLLVRKESLAFWFMDDGYYYHRDNTAYIYLPKYSTQEIKILLEALSLNFNLKPKVKNKKGSLVLVFPVEETKKLIALIRSFIVPSMTYKLPKFHP